MSLRYFKLQKALHKPALHGKKVILSPASFAAKLATVSLLTTLFYAEKGLLT